MGCIVIGLQSTGEARTLEQVEREEELSDFVPTSKGVLQSLVEKHFPAPDRGKITKILGLGGKQTTILDELGITTEKNGKKKSDPVVGKRNKRQAATKASKRVKMDYDNEDENDSDFAMTDDEDNDEYDEGSEASESDFNPFGSESDSDCDDPWERRGKKNGKKPKKPKKEKVDPFKHLVMGKTDENGIRSAPPDTGRVERAIAMKEDLLRKIDILGSELPANSLDELIDELG